MFTIEISLEGKNLQRQDVETLVLRHLKPVVDEFLLVARGLRDVSYTLSLTEEEPDGDTTSTSPEPMPQG